MSDSRSTLFELPVAPDGFGVILPPAQLRRIDFSGLDFDTARRAIVEYIKTYYPEQFNDFVASNGYMMMLEIVAAAVAKLSVRSDIIANESFLPTSTTEAAVSNHLALINQRMRRQTPAVVDVECTLNTPVFTDVRIPAGTAFSIRGAAGVQYELYRAPGDFRSDIVIPAGKRGVIAYGIEGVSVGPVRFISDGAMGQQYAVRDRLMLEDPISVEVFAGSQSERWIVVRDPIEKYGPLDKVVEVFWEGDTAIFKFGDNLSGSAPLPGQVIAVSYRSGGGTRGRIGTGQIDEERQVSPQPPANSPVTVRFRNVSPSAGGTDKETIEQAKRRAPKDYAARTGIVTADDYAHVAQTFSHPVYGSVLKAVAAIRTGLNANLVEVHCLAAGPDGRPVAPNAGLRAGLKTHYEQFNVLTDHVEVVSGELRPVDIEMVVVVNRTVDASVVKFRVEQAVTDFFDVANWDIGQPLYTSNLIEVVEAVDGVAHVDLFKPKDNILPGVAGGVQFNQLIVEGKRQVQYFYEKANRT